MPRIIDTHCHVNASDFDADRDAVYQRASGAGVIGLITVATQPNDWKRTLDLAEGRPYVRVALGIHPHEAGIHSPEAMRELKAMTESNSRVVAIGETGLDFFRNHSPREKQFESFQAQLDLAFELDKPFILHCRAAESEMMEVLAKQREKTGRPLKGVWHCFTSTPEFAGKAAAMGLHFGLGGILTYPKANDVRAAVSELPAERLLLETDCPYLPPQGWRGQRNEPAYLAKVVEVLAQVRQTTGDEICRITTANACALFNMNDL